MSDSSDLRTRQTLLLKIRDQADDLAWTDFVYYYRNFIKMLLGGSNLNHQDRQDIIQMVLLKCWEKLPEFDYDKQKGKFQGWLCRVTGNVICDFIRQQQRKKGVELDEFEGMEHYLNHFSESEVDIFAENEWRQYVPELAWKNLESQFTDISKNIFLMHRDGATTQEIAEKLRVSENQVYSYKKRVIDRLKQEVARLNHELN